MEDEDYQAPYLYRNEDKEIINQFKKRFPGRSKYPYNQIFFILDDLRKNILVKGMQ